MPALHPTDAAVSEPGKAASAAIPCRSSSSVTGPAGGARDRLSLAVSEGVGRGKGSGPKHAGEPGAEPPTPVSWRSSDGAEPDRLRLAERGLPVTGPCASCAVRGRALCGALDDEALAALDGLAQRRRVAAGETVTWAGDENLALANVVSGVLKMVAATPDGREQIVGLLYAADLVGQPYADQVDFTVTALTNTELCTFPRRGFERVLEGHARMENLLLRRTLKALHEARRRMLALARMSAPERVAGLLLDMAARAATGDGRASLDRSVTFDLPMTRGQMADVLGTTIETVSRQLTRLKGADVVAIPGSRTITIKDLRALKARAGLR